MRCTQGDISDVEIVLFFNIPEDFETDAAVLAEVKLDAGWNSEFYHTDSGEWFALRDAETGELALAGISSPDKWKPESIAPLSTAATDDPTCIVSSGEGDCLPGEIWRGPVTFSHEGGPSIEMYDGSRAPLSADGRDYDIILRSFTFSTCLSEYSRRSWLIGVTASG